MNKVEQSDVGISGRVEWEIEGPDGKKRHGSSNLVLNFTRGALVDVFVTPSTAFMPPRYIGLGDMAGTIAVSDTALANVLHYDGANDAKATDSVTRFSATTVRHSVQFTTNEGNAVIRQLGLYDASNDGNLWAAANVNIKKVAGERLTVYWYITFA